MSVLSRLYRNETTFDFVGRKRIGFTISAVLLTLTGNNASELLAKASLKRRRSCMRRMFLVPTAFECQRVS